ncbi:OLC1v1029780C1 [Oldenlandia corymbosa var. corymbosa]|uniref:OLC1v1029780C1 n=1 Tax=Oldenlandia corymbosa var. corymbosa TaxID=529605 RepID=A0AAV1CEJ1_OLDCO|nr:OLC1v1029780C1 [Oldenlandia corymbosa var. corymbosa]
MVEQFDVNGRMAEFENGSSLSEVKNLEDSLGRKGSVFDHDLSLVECGFDECKSRLRSLFKEVLVKFLRGRRCIKPLPAFSSDGVPVDFFKLFWVVRKLGGYDSTSRKNLWDFVAGECGLALGAVASVKLIYYKYLYDLDNWLWQELRNGNFLDEGDRIVKDLEDLVQHLMKEFVDFGNERPNKEKVGVKAVSEFVKCENGTHSRKRSAPCSPNLEIRYDNGDEEDHIGSDDNLVLSAKKINKKANNGFHGFSEGKTSDDDCKDCSQNGNDVTQSTKKIIDEAIDSNAHETACDLAEFDEEEFFPQLGDTILSSNSTVDKLTDSNKRKRESSSLTGMLSWIKNVAKHTDDIAIGRIPDYSKWKDHGNEEWWFQALLAREALLTRRHVSSPVVSSLTQKKVKMHPSMYEGVFSQQSVEKPRFSQRVPLIKSPSCSCCNTTPQSTVVIHQKADGGSTPKDLPLLSVEVNSEDKVSNGILDEPPEKEVSVGPLFQAEVPEWTGDVYESDAKWLGIRVWPPEDAKDETVIKFDPIEKGRTNDCECSFPGHSECVRFHIAEKRLKLKRELGSAFYKWRFDRMGEEVSLSWTMEEETRFKDMIKFSSQSSNRFWINALRLFPSKTREKLVSYYYNAFVIRRRSYQNRVTPEEVDSDDDEKELGLVGVNFGYNAIYVPELRLPVCSENRQCPDLE